MNQSEFETLMMAHDNLERELVDIKRLMGKDKHALIKSNIVLNKRVQGLEKENKRIRQMKYHEAYEQGKFDTNMKVWYEIPKLEQQNKRYREALEFYADRDNYKLEHFDPNLDDYMSTVDYDEGKKARRTIGSEKIND